MQRIPRRSSGNNALARILERAPRGLRELLGTTPSESHGDITDVAISARTLGRVLQISVVNAAPMSITALEVVLLVEFYDLDRTLHERRDIDFLAPGDEVLLAIPTESEAVSRVWCSTTFTLRQEQYSATGAVALT